MNRDGGNRTAREARWPQAFARGAAYWIQQCTAVIWLNASESQLPAESRQPTSFTQWLHRRQSQKRGAVLRRSMITAANAPHSTGSNYQKYWYQTDGWKYRTKRESWHMVPALLLAIMIDLSPPGTMWLCGGTAALYFGDMDTLWLGSAACLHGLLRSNGWSLDTSMGSWINRHKTDVSQNQVGIYDTGTNFSSTYGFKGISHLARGARLLAEIQWLVISFHGRDGSWPWGFPLISQIHWSWSSRERVRKC